MKSEVRGRRSGGGRWKSDVGRQRSEVRRRRSEDGFTLLELLIVIGLMVVLAGLLIPAFYKVVNEGKKRRAETESMIIGTAIQAYKMQERKFPAPPGDLGGGKDVTYDGSENKLNNKLVMALLTDTNKVPPFLDAGKLRWDADGNAMHPGDRQYKITLDLNYDGQIGGVFEEYRVE